MQKEECYYLGKITKPFGYKGQMVLFLDVDNPDAYCEMDSMLVDIKGSLVPYIFTITNLNSNRAIVEFEDLTADEAHALAGKECYLPLTLLPKLSGKHFYFHEVTDFAVIDAEKGNIGTLKSVIDYPTQNIFQILNGDIEILVPAIPQVIQSIDRENHTLYIEAPAGLIDLYMGEAK